MTQQEIIDQLVKSYNEKTGSNEAMLDAAFFIEAEFRKVEKQAHNKAIDLCVESADTKEYISAEDSDYQNGFVNGEMGNAWIIDKQSFLKHKL